MPYRWNDTHNRAPDIAGPVPYAPETPPLARLTLWPHRSLAPRGFVAAIGLMFVLGLVPVLSLLGSPLLWVIAGFMFSALAALYVALQKSYRHGLGETVEFWSDRMAITRTEPKGPAKHWAANPYWVRLELHPTGGPVEQYLTLKGSDREVELGAFLTPEERQALRDDLAFVLGQLKTHGA